MSNANELIVDGGSDTAELWNDADKSTLDSTGTDARRYRYRQNATALDRFAAKPKTSLNIDGASLTNDGAPVSSKAKFLARELEHVYNEVIEEEYAPNNALEYFPTERVVPPGAETHRVEKEEYQGEVKVRGEGRKDDLPDGGDYSKVSTQFNILTYVSSIQLDFFEQQAGDFVGENIRAKMERAVRQAFGDFLNEKTLFGSDRHGLYGAWNYPWLPETQIPLTLEQSTNPEAILYEFNRIPRKINSQTKQRFSPTALLTSPRVRDYLSETYRSGTTDESLLEAFLSKNSYIDSVEVAHECREEGPNGEDIMFFFRPGDSMSVVNVIPQGVEMLPMQERSFNMFVPMYMKHGGVIQRKPRHNALAYINVDIT